MTQTAELSSSVGEQGRGEEFGYSVAVSGKTILVGAPLAIIKEQKTRHGAAFVFEEPSGGWKDATENANFTIVEWSRLGYSVALTPDQAFVGAPDQRIGNSSGQGAAFVFNRPKDGWKTTSHFNSTLTDTSAFRLGTSVATQGSVAVTGAPTSGAGAGEAFVFGK